MMVVAAFITLAGTAMYEWYVEAPRISPLSPLDDQRLGGVIMWVPGALVVWISITVVYFRWTHREVEEDNERMSPKANRAGLVIPEFPQDRR
jgi:putative membrane protein